MPDSCSALPKWWKGKQKGAVSREGKAVGLVLQPKRQSWGEVHSQPRHTFLVEHWCELRQMWEQCWFVSICIGKLSQNPQAAEKSCKLQTTTAESCTPHRDPSLSLLSLALTHCAASRGANWHHPLYVGARPCRNALRAQPRDGQSNAQPLGGGVWDPPKSWDTNSNWKLSQLL